MPDDGLKLCNVAVLAAEGRVVALAVPLARLERLAPQLAQQDGLATGTVALTMEKRRMVADVTVEATLSVRCQRCLQVMSLPVASQSRVTLVESEADAAKLPSEEETALAPEGRMRLADLLEEELLLELPAAPRHSSECSGQSAKVEEFADSVQRPFAGLGALLKPGRTEQ